MKIPRLIPLLLAMLAATAASAQNVNVVQPAGTYTDNAIPRRDGTGNKVQDSAVTIADVAASNVTVSSTAGNALTLATADTDKPINLIPNGTGGVAISKSATPGSTFLNGLTLANTTAAAVNDQQYSLSIFFKGSGWKTNATAGSQAVDLRATLVPVQGAASPSSSFNMAFQVNGGGYTDMFTFSSGGAFAAASISAAGGITGGTLTSLGAIALGASSGINWATHGGMDTPADGVIRLYNNAASGFTRLDFGGTNNTFPALGVSSTTLEARLADNSGYTGFQSLYQRFGSGSPEGVVTAPVGSIYSRTNGSAGTSFYVKESGAGNTGWVSLVGSGQVVLATFNLSSGGAAIDTGTIPGTKTLPSACTLTRWSITATGATGTNTVKIWNVANGTAIPTIANVINTSGISLTTGTAVTSTTISDFTDTSYAALDMMRCAVTAVDNTTTELVVELIGTIP